MCSWQLQELGGGSFVLMAAIYFFFLFFYTANTSDRPSPKQQHSRPLTAVHRAAACARPGCPLRADQPPWEQQRLVRRVRRVQRRAWLAQQPLAAAAAAVAQLQRSQRSRRGAGLGPCASPWPPPTKASPRRAPRGSSGAAAATASSGTPTATSRARARASPFPPQPAPPTSHRRRAEP